MYSLMAFLFLVECHASKSSLLFHWGHLSIIVMLSRSNHVLSVACVWPRGSSSRGVVMALECSRFLVFKAWDVCPMQKRRCS